MNLQQVRKDVESAIRKAEKIASIHGENSIDSLIYMVVDSCDSEMIDWEYVGEHAAFMWTMAMIDVDDDGIITNYYCTYRYVDGEWQCTDNEVHDKDED